MKLQILQENFSKALLSASHFTNTKAQLPVLGNILLTTKKDKVLVSSTNLEIAVTISLGAQIKEEGTITIPAKVITELVSNLPSGPLLLETDKEQIKISSQKNSSLITGMNAADFPAVPQKSDLSGSVKLNKEIFLNSLSQILFAASIDETRPILTGVLFIFKKGELILVATDGFRLSQKRIDLKESSLASKLILPKNALGELSRLIEGEEVVMGYKEKDKQVLFLDNETLLSTRILEGEFPDFEKIIPKTSELKVYLDKQELERAIKLASVFARESANIVKFKINKDELEISAESSHSGTQKSVIDIKTEGKIPSGGFNIAFNYRFLEDLLHATKGEEIKMEVSNSSAPGVFTDSKDPDFLHLIMPVRVQD